MTRTCPSTDVLKAVVWARKYGIRINLDLHSVPGSQKCVLVLPLLHPTHPMLTEPDAL